MRPDDAHCYRPFANHPCHLIKFAVARRAIADLFAYLGDGFHTERILEPQLPLTTNLPPAAKQQVQGKLEQLNQIPPAKTAEKRTVTSLSLTSLPQSVLKASATSTCSSKPTTTKRHANFAKLTNHICRAVDVDSQHAVSLRYVKGCTN
ncbi:MAG: hypothetical protein AAF614_31185 [Chloroflexota bacterium]